MRVNRVSEHCVSDVRMDKYCSYQIKDWTVAMSYACITNLLFLIFMEIIDSITITWKTINGGCFLALQSDKEGRC